MIERTYTPADLPFQTMEAHESLGAYRFDDFVLDPGAFRLARHEEEIPREPKAIDLLLYLVQRPGQLASKEELISAIWMGTQSPITR